MNVHLPCSADVDNIGTDRAKLIDAIGSIQKKASIGDNWYTVGVDEFVPLGAIIRSSEYAAALLKLNGNNYLRLGENTTVELRKLGVKNIYLIVLISGKVWNLVNRTPGSVHYTVSTPDMASTTAGGCFAVFYDKVTLASDISVLNGSVVVAHDGKNTILNSRVSAGVNHATKEVHCVNISMPLQQMWSYLKKNEGWTKVAKELSLDKDFEVKCRAWTHHVPNSSKPVSTSSLKRKQSPRPKPN